RAAVPHRQAGSPAPAAAGAHRNPREACRHNRTGDPWHAPWPTEPYAPYVPQGRKVGTNGTDPRHGRPGHGSREPLTERGGENARALSAPLGVPPAGADTCHPYLKWRVPVVY